MTFWYVWHEFLICITCLSDMCAMIRSIVSHVTQRNDSCTCVPWLISHDMCAMIRSIVSRIWFICLTRLIPMCVPWLILFLCAIPHSYVWHDSFICVTGLICKCPNENRGKGSRTFHPYVWRQAKEAFLSSLIIDYPPVWLAPFTCVTGLVHMCAMTHAHVCHDSYMWHELSICVPSLVHMCAMTRS